jgi:DNA-binding XRE family transcriptional regulator
MGMEQSMDALSQLIKGERAIRGWSQGELAKRSGVSRKTISDIENGSLKRAPQLRTVHKLLWVLPTEPLPPGATDTPGEVTVTVSSPQRIIATWNTNATWETADVMTARPNGNGNTFGFTIMHGGNWSWPSISCRVG